MELDPHMQMDFGPAPQNYWGPPPLRPGEEQGGAPADDAAELTPAQVAPALAGSRFTSQFPLSEILVLKC